MILKAIEFASKKHEGQKDDSGKDYFEAHLTQVANLVRLVTDDENMICAAYLHDTLEDTNTTFIELVLKFNWVIACLVEELTHEGKKEENGHYFPRLKSKKAITIKFADRLSNISRMESWDKDRQNHYLKKSKFWKDSIKKE